MGSFVNFKEFIRHGGHGDIVLSLRSAEPLLEVKQASLDDTASAFEHRLRDLAAAKWSDNRAPLGNEVLWRHATDPDRSGQLGPSAGIGSMGTGS